MSWLPSLAARAFRPRTVAALLTALAAAAVQAEWVELPAASGQPAVRAAWHPRDAERRPAVLALHGCGGLFQKDGKTLERRYPETIERLHALGAHVLLPDSFGSRGEPTGICSQRHDNRHIGIQDRRADVIAALAWLRQRPEVDPTRLALLGWSHGGTTALAVLDAEQPAAAPPLAAVVTFYPGCGLFRHALPTRVPVLMELGGADDWTPPAPCQQLAERWQAGGAEVTLHVHPDAYHGFDSRAPVRFRTDVPNGVKKNGVHVGGNPAAREAALKSLDSFLRQKLQLD